MNVILLRVLATHVPIFTVVTARIQIQLYCVKITPQLIII